jgi:hypothetical protein
MEPLKQIYLRKVWFPRVGMCPECHHEGLLTHQIMTELIDENPPPFFYLFEGSILEEEHEKICNCCAILRKCK